MSGYDSSAAVSPKRCGTLSRIARKAAPDPRQSQIERAFPAIVNAVYRPLIIFGLNSLTSASAEFRAGAGFPVMRAGRVFVTA
jgi:hypothetical protein